MFFIPAFLLAWYHNRLPSACNPLQVVGRTPLFFYLIDVHLLAAGALVLNMYQTGGLSQTTIAAAAVLLVLYPLCRRQGRAKKVHPGSLLRFLKFFILWRDEANTGLTPFIQWFECISNILKLKIDEFI